MNELRLAGCILLDQNGAILLIHKNTDQYNHWEVPGGKVEPNESDEDAAARELEEELGIVVNIQKKLGDTKFIDKRPMQYHWFLATTEDRPEIKEPEKFDDLAYFTVEELQNSDLSLSMGAKKFASLVATGKIRL